MTGLLATVRAELVAFPASRNARSVIQNGFFVFGPLPALAARTLTLVTAWQDGSAFLPAAPPIDVRVAAENLFMSADRELASDLCHTPDLRKVPCLVAGQTRGSMSARKSDVRGDGCSAFSAVFVTALRACMFAILELSGTVLRTLYFVVQSFGVTLECADVPAVQSPTTLLVASALRCKLVEVVRLRDGNGRRRMASAHELELRRHVVIPLEDLDDIGPHLDWARRLAITDDVHPIAGTTTFVSMKSDKVGVIAGFT